MSSGACRVAPVGRVRDTAAPVRRSSRKSPFPSIGPARGGLGIDDPRTYSGRYRGSAGALPPYSLPGCGARLPEIARRENA